MSDQRTFRDVAKPLINGAPTVTSGVLDFAKSTIFTFTPASGIAITGFSGYEYLIDGQAILFVNDGSADITINVGTFSETLYAGYDMEIYWDKANNSFYDKMTPLNHKDLEDDISTNATAITTEATARSNEDLKFLYLDGTRVMTGDLDMDSNNISNVLAGSTSDQAINKGQFDTSIALLQSQISANSSALSWRSPVLVVSERISAAIPSNGAHLADISGKLFEDDNQTTPYTTSNFPLDKVVLFVKSGQTPKLMIARDDAGTKTWFDETESNAALKLERQASVGDTFIVTFDLLDDANKENSAIYHIVDGSPASAIKIGDIDWSTATGIKIGTGYTQGAGGATVTVGDTVQAALEKLDGNIAKEITDRTAADTAIRNDLTSTANGEGASLVGIEDSALNYTADTVEAALAEVVTKYTNAISTSQAAQNTLLASTANGEGASLIGVEDSALIYTATTVEGALAEVKNVADNNADDITNINTDITNLQTAVSNNATDITTNANAISTLTTDLASDQNGKGASMVGVEDTAGNFTGPTVEDALAEISTRISNLNLVEQSRGLYEATTGANDLDLTASGDFQDVLGGGGTTQDLSAATYMNTIVIRDGAIAIGGVGYTLAANVITFTAASGGDLVAGEVVEVRVTEIS